MGPQHNFIKNKEGDLDRVRQYKWTGSATFPPLPRYKVQDQTALQIWKQMQMVTALGVVAQSPAPEARDQYAQRHRFSRESWHQRIGLARPGISYL